MTSPFVVLGETKVAEYQPTEVHVEAFTWNTWLRTLEAGLEDQYIRLAAEYDSLPQVTADPDFPGGLPGELNFF